MKKPADLFEAEERLRASVAAGAKLSLGDRVPSGRGGRWPTRKKIRADVILAVLRAAQEPAKGSIGLWVEGACIIGTLDLRHAQLTMPLIMKHCSFDGRVDLSEAHAVSVSLSGSRFPSFCGYGLKVDGDADFSGCRAEQVDIFGARIGGRLWLSGAEVSRTGSGYALNAPDLKVDGGMYCRGVQVAGGINLYNATIGSALELNGAVLSNQDGPALRAPGLSVKADMSCGMSFHAMNTIDMFGAQIGGQLWLNDARLETGGGDRTLNAPQISVVGGLYCNGQFSASGMINLFGAVIGSTLEFNGATLSDASGKCLRAPGLTVKNSAYFTGCTVTGEIDLAGAHIGGELQLTETQFTDSTLDLRGADVGQLHAGPASLPGRLRLNGLTYASLHPYLPALQRLEILRRDIDGYQPQPYEQLAAYYRTLGYDEHARTVLLSKQRSRRVGLAPAAKAWGYLQDVVIGYGYRPARALIWLVVLVALTAVYVAAYPPRAASGSPHAQVEPIIYAFYTVVPVLNIGHPNPYPASATGQWIIWIAQLAGWALASTVIAGITRALSRN